MTNLGNKQIMAKNLQKLVANSGKTRQEICDDLGIPYSTFSEWTNAKKYPRIDKIEKMANYFNVKKSDLVEDQSGLRKPPNDELYYRFDCLSDWEQRIVIQLINFFFNLKKYPEVAVVYDVEAETLKSLMKEFDEFKKRQEGLNQQQENEINGGVKEP